MGLFYDLDSIAGVGEDWCLWSCLEDWSGFGCCVEEGSYLLDGTVFETAEGRSRIRRVL